MQSFADVWGWAAGPPDALPGSGRVAVALVATALAGLLILRGSPASRRGRFRHARLTDGTITDALQRAAAALPSDRGLEMGMAMAVTVVPGRSNPAAITAAIGEQSRARQDDELAATLGEEHPVSAQGRHRFGRRRRRRAEAGFDFPGDSPAGSSPDADRPAEDLDDAPSPLPLVEPPGRDAVYMTDSDTPPVGVRVMPETEQPGVLAQADPNVDELTDPAPDDEDPGTGWWTAGRRSEQPADQPADAHVIVAQHAIVGPDDPAGPRMIVRRRPVDDPHAVPSPLSPAFTHPSLCDGPEPDWAALLGSTVDPAGPDPASAPAEPGVTRLAPPVESHGWRADPAASVVHEVLPTATGPVARSVPKPSIPPPSADQGPQRLSLADLPDVSPDPEAEHKVVAQIVDDILASLGVGPSAPSGAVPAPRLPAPRTTPSPRPVPNQALHTAASNARPALTTPALTTPALTTAGPSTPTQRIVPTSHSPNTAQREALRASSRRLSAASNRISVAEITAREAAQLVEADTAALVVRSVEGPRVLWLHPAGGDTEIWGPQTLAALLGVGAAVREVLAGDPLAGGSPTALLSVPVASGGALVGTLVVRRNSAQAFSLQELGVLDRLARMSGAALDALTRRGALNTEGQLDPVTQLAVRDRLDTDLRAALRSRIDHDLPVMLLIAEVDGLARMRTEQGAREADGALELIASSVATSLRVGDLAYRFGPDELAILLPSTQAADAELVAERLTGTTDALIAERLDLVRPLRLRVAAVPVEGTVEEVVDAATRALATERVKDRWTKRRPVPNR